MKELRKIRKERGLTVRACSEAVGVSHRRWTRYEGLKSEPDLETAGKMAQFLGVTIEQLCGLKTA